MTQSQADLQLDESAAPPAQPPAQPPPAQKPPLLWAIVFHAAAAAILALIAYQSFYAGLQWRRQIWDQTIPIRFTGDVANGFNYGLKAQAQGYVQIYDSALENLAMSRQRNPQFVSSGQLDYAPLRLWIMMRWVDWAKTHFPVAKARQQQHWLSKYEFNEPVLNFNTAMELASSLAAFGLVWVWVRRRAAPQPRGLGFLDHRLARPWRGVGRATAAALLIWFNPALIWNGHAWPQWDGWVVAFFLWAALLASLDAWFCAGALIAVGVMCKGQTLAGAPVLLLWPLLGGQFKAAARFVIGLALAGAMVLWPWLSRDPAALKWLYGAAAAIVLIAVLALLSAYFRWPGKHLPLRHWPIALAALAAVALWLCIPWFHGDTAPIKVAFEYGASKYSDLARSDVNNLPALLQTHFHWKTDDPATTIRLLGTHDLTLKQLLWGVYALCVLLCGLAAAMQARRRDPRLLLALAAPWILFFALVPQMHQRYLVWGAAISALAIGVDFPLALIHGIITAAAWAMQAHSMLNQTQQTRRFSPSWLQFLDSTHPGVGWVVLLCGTIFLYFALTPRRSYLAAPLAGRVADAASPDASIHRQTSCASS